MTDEKTYYLYRHIRKDTNLPFYIGIGTIYTKRGSTIKALYSRAFERKKSRNKYWKNIINKTDYIVQILFETTDMNSIQEKEKYFIELYGIKDRGGILCNLTTGGLGINGFTHTDSAKKRIAEDSKTRKRKKGYKLQMSDEGRKNLKHFMQERTVSNETRQKMSSNMKGNKRGKRYYDTSSASDASISTVPLSNCADS